MDLKGIIADHMGHFSVYDIPAVLFVTVLAALLGYVLARFGAQLAPSEVRYMALWASLAALATAFVRSQLPIAALVLAAAVLVGKRPVGGNDALFFAILAIGIGCGSGASVVVSIAVVPVLLIMRWALRSTGS